MSNLPETRDDWEQLLKNDARDSVLAILNQGLHIYQYSKTCPSTSGGSYFRKDIKSWLGYSSSTATVWCNIGKKYEALIESKENLPLSYFSIAELTKLKPDDFSKALESGDIHPGMSQSDVKQLRNEIEKEHYQKKIDKEKEQASKKTADFNPADFLGKNSKRNESESKPEQEPDAEPVKKKTEEPKESKELVTAKRYVTKLFDIMQNKLTDSELDEIFKMINPMFCDGRK